jgi:hypothetical protein
MDKRDKLIESYKFSIRELEKDLEAELLRHQGAIATLRKNLRNLVNGGE